MPRSEGDKKRVTKVYLEMLAKTAVLVDCYECSEAIELFFTMWIADLRNNSAVPSTYCRELVLWIWIAWVFDINFRDKDCSPGDARSWFGSSSALPPHASASALVSATRRNFNPQKPEHGRSYINIIVRTNNPQNRSPVIITMRPKRQRANTNGDVAFVYPPTEAHLPPASVIHLGIKGAVHALDEMDGGVFTRSLLIQLAIDNPIIADTIGREYHNKLLVKRSEVISFTHHSSDVWHMINEKYDSRRIQAV
jgi:hypothetical protein